MAALEVTIIIPVLEEAEGLGEVLGAIPPFGDGGEVIVVDGGSTDDSLAVAGRCSGDLRRRGLVLRLLQAERGRARQMNAGAAAAHGDVLLFLHADTILPRDAPGSIARAMRSPEVVGGGFRHRFREAGAGLRAISLASNLRARLGGALYGDQAIFVRREVFRSLGGYRPLPIFEDADLTARLRGVGRMALLPSAVRTSGRRFLEGGLLRTLYRMLRLKLAWRGGRGAAAAGDYWDDSRRGLGRRRTG